MKKHSKTPNLNIDLSEHDQEELKNLHARFLIALYGQNDKMRDMIDIYSSVIPDLLELIKAISSGDHQGLDEYITYMHNSLEPRRQKIMSLGSEVEALDETLATMREGSEVAKRYIALYKAQQA